MQLVRPRFRLSVNQRGALWSRAARSLHQIGDWVNTHAGIWKQRRSSEECPWRRFRDDSREKLAQKNGLLFFVRGFKGCLLLVFLHGLQEQNWRQQRLESITISATCRSCGAGVLGLAPGGFKSAQPWSPIQMIRQFLQVWHIGLLRRGVATRRAGGGFSNPLRGWQHFSGQSSVCSFCCRVQSRGTAVGLCDRLEGSSHSAFRGGCFSWTVATGTCFSDMLGEPRAGGGRFASLPGLTPPRCAASADACAAPCCLGSSQRPAVLLS